MKYARNSLVANKMVITPSVAAEMLTFSRGNRKLRTSWVKVLTYILLSSEWRVTHQGIAFDTSGVLRDGHHRLSACVKAGVNMEIMVTLGMSEEACDAIDRGLGRSVADVMSLDKRITEPLRLATKLYHGNSTVTVPQVVDIGSSGLLAYLQVVVGHCRSARRYYSSAPVKLAAALKIMDGSAVDYILDQYRALCLLDFDRMSPASQALVRQVSTGVAFSNNTSDTLARGLKVFDVARMDMAKIPITDADIASAREYMRSVINSGLGAKS